MDVHLKFPYEDQLAENDLEDSVWKTLQALTVRSSSNWSTKETVSDLMMGGGGFWFWIHQTIVLTSTMFNMILKDILTVQENISKLWRHLSSSVTG